jgi:hypothetical protein
MKSLYTALALLLFVNSTPLESLSSTPQEQIETFTQAPYRIVFIHLGTALPPFLSTALNQARLFNPNAAIVLIASQAALDATPIADDGWIVLPAESIQKTVHHTQFSRSSHLDRSFREGFWFYTTERIFYLDDFITQYNLTDVFHLENDNLLYCNLGELLPVFRANYKGIAIPFEQDFRGGAGFLFAANHIGISAFAEHLRDSISLNKSEMELLGTFKKKFGNQYIEQLPVITPTYIRDHLPLTDASGRKDLFNPTSYHLHIDQFQSIFDMCSYGQYVGGIDPRNAPEGPGYVNPSAIFKCSELQIVWEDDDQMRTIPYVVYRGEKYRINNLHIHCKDLDKFSSLGSP